MRDDQSDKAEQTGETDDTSGKDACEGQKQKRVSETRSPRERAMSSPSPSIFNGCARNKETKNAIAIQRHGRISLLRVSPEREPIRKDVRFTVISVFKSLIVLMPALKKLETVIPARMIVVLELSESAARKRSAVW